MPPYSKHAFISYTKADRQWAEWIGWILEEAGYSVTLDVWDFRPGHDFVQKMDEALKQCEKLIAVLSEDYLQADFTRPEWRSAFADDPQGEKRRLVFVRVRECQLDGLLKSRLYLDLVGASEATAKQDILAIWKDRGKPDVEPPFPGENSRVTPSSVEFPTTAKQRRPWNIPYQRNAFFTGREDILKVSASSARSGQYCRFVTARCGQRSRWHWQDSNGGRICLPLSRHVQRCVLVAGGFGGESANGSGRSGAAGWGSG